MCCLLANNNNNDSNPLNIENKIFDRDLFLFSNIINILSNNPINYETQSLIESFVYKQYNEILNVNKKDHYMV